MSSTSVYFSPYKVHFKPLPEFTVTPHWFVKHITWLSDSEKVPVEFAWFYIGYLRVSSFIGTYVASPNFLLPIQIFTVIKFASDLSSPPLNRVINVVFSMAVLGLFAKYTQDGTLHKLSEDFYTTANEAKSAHKRLESGNYQEVTFTEPFQFSEKGFFGTIISSINDFLRKIFRCIFFCRDQAG